MMFIPEDKRVAVLKELYRNTFVAPVAIMFGSAGPRELSDARTIIGAAARVHDYLDGHMIKMDLTAEDVNVRLYDRDNGYGAAARIIESVLRS